ncbi:MAG: histidine kinase dimerization/phospho-acceptor domain-containing protein, partial [Desulfobacterales bacterium]|nr:histidine kinase dimerization/phospho-acceptor domain-containing protein [Desulfobacterales bacterium]MDX2510904.1 histidine kinase dimerization/phospho-acceptor domain-containing protein [Desulfobacterales bacterium]
MTDSFRGILKLIRPDFFHQPDKHLNPYFTFADYNKIWAMGILVLGLTVLVPLITVTVIHYQLIQKSVDSELVLRTERLTSNARRAVTFFLEERLDAWRFTVNEIEYTQLTTPEHLSEILRNIKLGFGGLSDLSVISSTGTQIAYAGPFNFEGRNYSDQHWFIECRKNNYYVSEIFRGYRDVPHIIIAVKSFRADNTFFILRATLETERLRQMLISYETGKHADIFLVNRSGIIQTQSKHYGSIFKKMTLLSVPKYSQRTQTIATSDGQGQFIAGYAFISTQIADTPFILMVIKQKEGMTGIWDELLTKINWFVSLCVMIVLIVVTITCTFMVNKMFLADKAKAETLALVEQTNQLASVGQLAAGVAHEINNPLALINETAGYIKDLFTIAETYRQDDELMENIDSIMEAVERCGRITGQLLGFARKFDIEIQKINLKEIISDVLNFHNKEAEYRNITVTVDISEESIEIESDRGKLQQILLNLVNNAFQAIDDGCWL